MAWHLLRDDGPDCKRLRGAETLVLGVNENEKEKVMGRAVTCRRKPSLPQVYSQV